MSIADQISAVTERYPSLSVIPDKDGYLLTGIVTMAKTYNDVPLYDEYHIKIFIPSDFPRHIPSVFDTNNDVPEEFMHFLGDGSFCLGAYCDLRSFLDTHPSIVGFIDEIVMSYLYSVSYFRTYGVLPYGARSHGVQGKIEAYQERYSTDNNRVLAYLLFCLLGEIPYRGHHLCPCGSGKHLRNCHGSQLIRDIRSPYLRDYQNDVIDVLSHLAKQEERKSKKQNGKSRSSEKQF